MRKFFFLMILAGFGVGFAYPWYMYNMSGAEIGTFAAYRQHGGFSPFDVVLSESQSPVRVFVDMTPIKGYYPDRAHTMLTLTASQDSHTVLTSTLSYIASSEESRNLQSSEKVFRDRAGDLVVQKPGVFHFVVGEGDIEGLSLRKVDVVLRQNAEETDPRAFPAGMALLGLGILGMIRSGRRSGGREPSTVSPTPAEPEKPKWGRDAADQ